MPSLYKVRGFDDYDRHPRSWCVSFTVYCVILPLTSPSLFRFNDVASDICPLPSTKMDSGWCRASSGCTSDHKWMASDSRRTCVVFALVHFHSKYSIFVISIAVVHNQHSGVRGKLIASSISEVICNFLASMHDDILPIHVCSI